MNARAVVVSIALLAGLGAVATLSAVHAQTRPQTAAETVAYEVDPRTRTGRDHVQPRHVVDEGFDVPLQQGIDSEAHLPASDEANFSSPGTKHLRRKLTDDTVTNDNGKIARRQRRALPGIPTYLCDHETGSNFARQLRG